MGRSVYVRIMDHFSRVDHTENVGDCVLIDKTKSGRVIGVEILNIRNIELADEGLDIDFIGNFVGGQGELTKGERDDRVRD